MLMFGIIWLGLEEKQDVTQNVCLWSNYLYSYCFTMIYFIVYSNLAIPTILNQLLQFLPQKEFEKAISEYKSDKYVKYFKTKALFVVHLYAQIRKKDSLRDIVSGLDQHKNKWYHIGIEKIKRSTISDANNRIPYQVYEKLFYSMLKKCQNLTKCSKFKFKNPLYALDSSIIDLCLSVFDWAKFRRTKGA